jgi:hypothetical protein
VQSRENKKLNLGSLILKMDRAEAEAAARAAAAEAETQRAKFRKDEKAWRAREEAEVGYLIYRAGYMAGAQQKAPAKVRAQQAMDRTKVDLAALTAEKEGKQTMIQPKDTARRAVARRYRRAPIQNKTGSIGPSIVQVIAAESSEDSRDQNTAYRIFVGRLFPLSLE